jgi:hypothetical protein
VLWTDADPPEAGGPGAHPAGADTPAGVGVTEPAASNVLRTDADPPVVGGPGAHAAGAFIAVWRVHHLLS